LPSIPINTNTASVKDVVEYVEIQTEAQTSAWINFDGLRANADALINAIAAADSHGLNSDSYQLNSLEQAIQSFVDNSEKSGTYISESNLHQRAELEKSLNQAFTQLARDLGKGVLNAQKTQKNLHRPAPVVDTDALLVRLHSGNETVDELIAELTPSSSQYNNLVNHMSVLLAERDSGARRTKVQYIKGVSVDTAHDLVLNLRSRLIETGDLDANSAISTYFDHEVSEALMAVQNRHGITASGELTESTVIALNQSVEDDIEQVAMNLERWRWMPRDLGDRHIGTHLDCTSEHHKQRADTHGTETTRLPESRKNGFLSPRR